VKLKWFGHSCFLLTADSGVKVLIDPFDPEVGYKLPPQEADIVTTSHNHEDHNYLKAVSGKFKHLNKPGAFSERGIEITGIVTYHDKVQGKKSGRNVVFKFTVDGLNICHCGDLGHVFTAEQLQALGPVDVLLVPVGGNYTIDHELAAEVCSLVSPKVIIPMHYKTEVNDYPIAGVDLFLTRMGGGKVLDKPEIELTPNSISSYAPVVVLSYK